MLNSNCSSSIDPEKELSLVFLPQHPQDPRQEKACIPLASELGEAGFLSNPPSMLQNNLLCRTSTLGTLK